MHRRSRFRRPPFSRSLVLATASLVIGIGICAIPFGSLNAEAQTASVLHALPHEIALQDGEQTAEDSQTNTASEGVQQPETKELSTDERVELLEEELARLKQASELNSSDASEALLAGHNGWMLVCTALVLFMTAPGLALFYGGLVRKKNVISVMTQCLFLMGMMTVVWVAWGYSFAFGGDGKWFGNFDHIMLRNISRTFDAESGEVVVPMYNDSRIPLITHVLFQGMFFIITPALICGAFAERMSFRSMVVFSLLWGTFVYCPLCHWVWDGGILQYGAEGAIAGGALDFAGGTVVHISSGISALICALLIGQRFGFGREPMVPHNLTYTAMGAAMLWIGWFGFNAGSGMLSDELASNAFAVTHFAAAAGAVAWVIMELMTRGKAGVLGTSSGAIAGLVCITPAAGFVTPVPAIIMGLAAGIVCFLTCTVMKSKLGYDDSLDAFGIHGAGGILGAVLTGVFATRACLEPDGGSAGLGLIEGNVSLIIGQVVAVIMTIAFATVMTFVLLKILDMTLGLRVTREQEQRGLDLEEHGEEGYIFL